MEQINIKLPTFQKFLGGEGEMEIFGARLKRIVPGTKIAFIGETDGEHYGVIWNGKKDDSVKAYIQRIQKKYNLLETDWEHQEQEKK